MAKKNRKNQQSPVTGLSNLEIACAAFGVSPIPIVGEICLGEFFNSILKDSPIKGRGIAYTSAMLTRMGLYSMIYAPLYNELAKYFSK